MKRRSRALQKRYGRARARGGVVRSGLVEVQVKFDPARDVYRGDVSWPEMPTETWERARRGERVRADSTIRHHKIEVVRAANVLVRFSDVTRPSAPDKLAAAAGIMIQQAGVQGIAEWHAGMLRAT